jgi:hypothetical protein
MSVITLNIEGYIQCRLATDPDPTDERRGVSGYTFALPGEPDLDWIIYTQPGPGVVPRVGVEREVGVKVIGGFCGTQAIISGHPLFNAPVILEDQPRFEERNYIMVTTSFGVIAPFKLRVKGKGIEIFRQVDWYPGKPLDFPLWETPQNYLNPYVMQSFDAGAADCAALLGASQNPSVYRKERLNTLLHLKETSRLTPDGLAAIDKRIEQLRMDDPRDRRTAQLVNRANYSYAINGPASLKLEESPEQWLNGNFVKKEWQYLRPDQPLSPWPFNFWIGSWDADSLTAYLKGTIQIYDLGPNFEAWLKGEKEGAREVGKAAAVKGAKRGLK